MSNELLSESENYKYRKVLFHAAFFTGKFSIDWLQELTEEKASTLFGALELGVSNNWITRSTLTDFTFSDGSERDRLINLASPSDIEAVHRKIADIFKKNICDLSDKTSRIAYHLLYISNDYDGCRNLIEAGNIYRREFKDDKARLYYEKAITDLRQLSGNEAKHLFITSALEYAKVSTDSDDPESVIAILEEAISLAESLKDLNSIVFLKMHLGKSEWLRSHYQSALKHFTQGLEINRFTGDPAIEKSVSIFGMFFHYWSGNYLEVIQIYESLVPDVEDQIPKGRLPLLAALTAGVCLGHTGMYSQAFGMLDAIRAHGRAIGNLSISALAGVSMGYLLLEIQREEDAIHCILESLKETETSKSLYARLGGLELLCYAYHRVGNNKQALSCLREYLDISQKSQMTVKFSATMMLICKAMEDGTLPRIEGLCLEEEIRYSIDSGNLLMTGVALRHKAIMLRQAGHPVKDVVPLLEQSISSLTVCGHQIELANAKIELVREYLREGDTKKAFEYAEPAVRSLYSYNETLVPDDIRPLVRDLCHTNSLIDEIMNLSQELTTIRDSKMLFSRIISTINRITGAERGAIFVLRDDSPEQVVLRSAKNLTAEDIVSPQFQESMKLINETARTGRGRVNEPCVRHTTGGAIGNEIRSCICVPLTIRAKLVGVLYHDNRLFRSAFKESDLKILHYFAAQAAIAMDNAEAWRRLQKLYEQEQLEKKHYEKEYLGAIHFDGFVGKSQTIRRVFAQAEQVAQTDTTVLILGETGVGKELVARSIHRNSSRSHKPFVRVHCSALPESLISTELFGHEKGAFTGATEKKIGRFELANGGTIFLDEIGDISMDIQIKLLRVLQSKEFERVGGNETLQSDFRLIAATNRNFEQEVEKGRYRRDLYYRLKVFPITVPPLRARRADIEPLSYYFLNLYSKKFNKPISTIPQKELERLQRYEWPGNVRELENVIERGVILSTGKSYITPELDNEATHSDKTYISLKENERNHILRVLKHTNGKVTGPGGASEILAIHPNTLFSKMKKLGISRKAKYIAKNFV